MKKQFNEYMEDEAPIQLKVLFHEMDESQAIMLQECFHAFARKVVRDVQSKDGKLPIPHVNGIRLCLVADPRTFKLSINLSSAIKYEPMLKTVIYAETIQEFGVEVTTPELK